MPRQKTAASKIIRHRHQIAAANRQQAIIKSSNTTVASNNNIKRAYRHQSGVVANMEIRRLQLSNEPCIPLAPFARFVKELVQDYFSQKQLYRMTKGALLALRTSAEDFLVQLFADCNRAAKHRHRKTIAPEV